MSNLIKYLDEVTTPMPPIKESCAGGAIDMIFIYVKCKDTASKETLLKLIEDHKGEFNEVNLFDGEEHSFIELGGWIGDQGYALRLMALGYTLGMWNLLTPRTIIPSICDDSDEGKALTYEMAGAGLVTIKADIEEEESYG